jgi:SAM-dependent methyltransferase
MATRTLYRALGAVPGLRSTWWLSKSLIELAQNRPPKVAAWSENLFQNKLDPWDMEHSEIHLTRYRDVGQMLDKVQNGRKFATAHEIACAEGTCTRKMLAERCEALLATDVSPTAVERARASCAGLSHVRFAVFDIMADPSPGVFDLTLVMGFLQAFSHRRDLEIAREKAVAMTAPNGYLLLSNAVWWVAEEFWWGRWLPRGAKWQDHFFAQHPKLKVVDTMRAPWFLHTLFRKPA